MLPSLIAKFKEMGYVSVKEVYICGCCIEMYIVAQKLKIIDSSVFFISRCQFLYFIGSIWQMK